MTEQAPDPAAFSKVDFPGVYKVEIKVTGTIYIEIEADSPEAAKAKAREAAEQVETDDEAELDEIADARAVGVMRKSSLYRVLRNGYKIQVSRLSAGDEPREPDEQGFCPMTGPTPLSQIAAAAKLMLDNHDAFMSGAPCDKDIDRHVTLAACFGASAYEAAPCTDSGTHAMLRAFLQALIDPMHPDLDYLRADPQAGVAAREAHNDRP